jgi:NADH:ubiquinone oxidoreductase subunit 6 (subunit J)
MSDLIILLVVYLKEKFLFSKWTFFGLFFSTLFLVGSIFFIWKLFFDVNVDLPSLLRVSVLLGLVCSLIVVVVAWYERRRHERK